MAQADGFLRTVIKSGLLDSEQLERALESAPKGSRLDPEELANHLIKLGKLSPFQAYKLLQGVFQGLRLGPYQILAPISRGGMGMVYLAKDAKRGHYVALKILPPKKARGDEKYLARFQREMELSQRVSHAHLARTLDAGVFQGINYIALEFIPGQSLHRLVGQEGPLRVSRAARLFAEAASALEHIHSHGLIHRDLKPSNIMITPRDHAKLLDLGLAIIEGEEVEDIEVVGGRGYVVGSFDYIAPEQIKDSTQVDGRSDIYSLGCTIYFALSGQPPFPGGDYRDKIQHHRHAEPLPLPELNPTIPVKFSLLVQKMMAKQPDWRFPSAAVLRDELLTWCSEKPIQPLDRADDQGYQQAIASLMTAPLSRETIEAEEAQEGRPRREDRKEGEEDDREWLWLTLGLGGFWGIILISLILVLLLR